MNDAEVHKLFEPLFAGLQGEDSFPKNLKRTRLTMALKATSCGAGKVGQT